MFLALLTQLICKAMAVVAWQQSLKLELAGQVNPC